MQNNNEKLIIKSNNFEIILNINVKRQIVNDVEIQCSDKFQNKNLLESYKSIILNKSIREIYEHSHIYLFDLNREIFSREDQGIIFPELSDKFYEDLVTSMRTGITKYTKKNPFRNQINFSYKTVEANWLDLEHSEKIKKVESWLKLFDEKKIVQISASDVNIYAIKRGQITLLFNEGLSANQKSIFCLKFEIFIRNLSKNTLEIFCPEMQDTNILRRLAVK